MKEYGNDWLLQNQIQRMRIFIFTDLQMKEIMVIYKYKRKTQLQRKMERDD